MGKFTLGMPKSEVMKIDGVEEGKYSLEYNETKEFGPFKVPMSYGLKFKNDKLSKISLTLEKFKSGHGVAPLIYRIAEKQIEKTFGVPIYERVSVLSRKQGKVSGVAIIDEKTTLQITLEIEGKNNCELSIGLREKPAAWFKELSKQVENMFGIN